ncbi:MAG: hypothetical protein M3Y87_36920, partial [Myxococcota bacterium]|nr:hypothetical protein [Myxococcota bacterium]
MSRLPQLLASIRRALVLRAMLAEIVLWSAVLGTLALAVALAWPALPRWPSLVLLGLAPIVGLLRARRSRPSDADLVMWVDRRLAADEAVITAWEVGGDPPAVLADTIARANERLSGAR